MRELVKPPKTIYWIARNETGDVLHTGETNPNQVTSTGLPVFEYDEDEEQQLQKISAFTEKLPDLPTEGEWVEAGQIYRQNGRPVKAIKSHRRTDHSVTGLPDLFKVSKRK